MKIDPDAPAYPQVHTGVENVTGRPTLVLEGGMSIRATMATHIRAGAETNPYWDKESTETCAEMAVQEADALIAALNR